jgi:hypothetical protein
MTVNEPLLEIQKTAILKPTSSGTACETRIVAAAGDKEGDAVATATVGKLSADVKIKITEAGHKRNPKLDFEVSGRDNPPNRISASTEEGKLMIRIYGKHKSLSTLFGKHTGDGFENENSPEAGATIAELLAQQLASYVVEREAELHPERFSDSAMIFARQQHYVAQFAVTLQAGLVNM